MSFDFGIDKGKFFQFIGITATGSSESAKSESGTHTVQVVVTGSPSALSVKLQGSLDNKTWSDLNTAQDMLASSMFTVIDKPVLYVRINAVVTGGTNPSAIFNYYGTNK